jgi:hypothetical protein
MKQPKYSMEHSCCAHKHKKSSGNFPTQNNKSIADFKSVTQHQQINKKKKKKIWEHST